MNEEIFQKLLDIIFPILPEDWTGFVLRGTFTKEGNEIKLYIRDGINTYHDCFALGIPNEEVIETSKLIYEELIRLRESSDKEPWTAITMTIDNEGNFTSDFDYSAIELFDPDYNTAWENRYLK